MSISNLIIITRAHRKMFHQHFQSRSLARFHPFKRKAVLKLINGLIESGGENGSTAGYEGHIQR